MTLIADDYGFYAGFLRFVAAKTEKTDPTVHAMMAELDQAASQIEQGNTLEILTSRVQIASRAFAGVAQFLQHRILPEAQAHGDQKALGQLEWAVAASLQIGRAIILYQDKNEKEDIKTDFIAVDLPPLDRIPGQNQTYDTQTLH